VAKKISVGRSHSTTWEGTRNAAETDGAIAETHTRIDGLKIPHRLAYAVAGVLAVNDDQAGRLSPGVDFYPTNVRLAVPAGDEPAGSPIIVDIRVGGDSLFTGNGKPNIPDGKAVGNGKDFALDVIKNGDDPLIDIDQVGSGTAGSNLTVVIHGYVFALGDE